jgi:hypothetical protein
VCVLQCGRQAAQRIERKAKDKAAREKAHAERQAASKAALASMTTEELAAHKVEQQVCLQVGMRKGGSTQLFTYVCAHICVFLPKTYVGLARTIYVRCIYGIFGRKITNYTVIYGAYIRFWSTLDV